MDWTWAQSLWGRHLTAVERSTPRHRQPTWCSDQSPLWAAAERTGPQRQQAVAPEAQKDNMPHKSKSGLRVLN